jgi:hypothetical protein
MTALQKLRIAQASVLVVLGVLLSHGPSYPIHTSHPTVNMQVAWSCT